MKRKHWYFTYTTECPLCGRGETRRERRYGSKPSDPRKRYSFEHHYDYCDAFSEAR